MPLQAQFREAFKSKGTKGLGALHYRTEFSFKKRRKQNVLSLPEDHGLLFLTVLL